MSGWVLMLVRFWPEAASRLMSARLSADNSLRLFALSPIDVRSSGIEARSYLPDRLRQSGRIHNRMISVSGPPKPAIEPVESGHVLMG